MSRQGWVRHQADKDRNDLKTLKENHKGCKENTRKQVGAQALEVTQQGQQVKHRRAITKGGKRTKGGDARRDKTQEKKAFHNKTGNKM